MLKSAPDRYGSVAVTLHWLSAVLIVALLLTGFRAAGAGDATKAALLRVHVPAALLVLLLTVARLGWWLLFDRRPRPAPDTPRWQDLTARAVHLGLYALIIVLGASGIGMIALSGAAPAIFAGGSLPNFDTYPPRVPHGVGARLLIALLALHVTAALYHHFIRGDGLLGRMWYGAAFRKS